ncbi:MAG: LytTR family DNA-binding domain-containing protein [Lachnospiraceae bacterium]|nr:LytTR family DNA-binding domain-containing protein [Lachnospiraceae bacterium]
MIRIAACDGVTPYVCELGKILREWGNKRGYDLEYFMCPTPDALLLEFELHGHLDLVFLDLHPAGEQSGIDAALRFKRLDPTTEIIFVFSECLVMPDIILARPAAYFLKPLQKGKLTDFLEQWASERKDDKFCFSMRQIRYALPVRRIRYIYHFNRKIYIYLDNGECPEAYMRLEEAEERLKDCDASFLKAHFSYLVNLYYVQQMGKSMLRLDGGEELPVSRSRGKEICGMFDAYLSLYGQNRASYPQNRT